MKKCILIFCAALPLAAWADVRLYGDIRSGVTTSRITMDGERRSGTSIDDFGSYIGMRGSHPIGGNNNVIWQFEQGAPVSNSSGSMRDYFRKKKENSMFSR
ncbi:hypothetical protein [Neisseria montereyensis]|uniref:Porin n=1 Tax=Neisseria montereyensis TaxID=2973938 RepID=A0ABT2FD29_9NEIS|nr:hypothetical protein [Neisseria montereyensis]MCS4533855.1 hypothetical protein [Neisseria montereyensis]